MLPSETIKHLGLEEKEASAYLALLECGENTVSGVAKRAGIKRPTTYLVLQSLEEKGYAARMVKAGKIYFSAQHPKKLAVEAEIRLKEIQTVLPQLESLFHHGSGKPRVTIFEGKDVLDRAFDDMFVVKGEALFMGTLKFSMEAFPRTFHKFEYAELSSEFNVRELIDESADSRNYARKVSGPYRHVRFIPEERLPFEIDISVFGNRALITSVKKEFFTVSIESEEVSHAFRTIFETMWQVSRE